MSKEETFISAIAPLIQKHAPTYNILCPSALIAQACLESGYGTSNKVKEGYNYFGLKWRNNRCAISNDYFIKETKEELPNGKYTTITSKFFKFKNMEDGVIGYFQWTNTSNYANLKNVKTPEEYLKNIKLDKYATDSNYVNKCMTIVNKWNLTKYDTINNKEREDKKMAIKIAIDAGHGSNTAGKRSVDGYREHWINVKTAYYCEQFLKAHGIETVRIAWNDLISTDDPDVGLTTRQAQVKAAKCDYSVSLHANAHGNGLIWTSAAGAVTLYHNNKSYVGDSVALANKVQARLIQGTKQLNRGAKPQALSMCNCPKLGTKASVLVEIGFMTNKEEANLMKTDAFCKEQGEDVAKGILDYLGIPIKTVNTTVTESSKPATEQPKTDTKPVTNTTTKDTYTVQSGDSLSKIGTKVGVSWKTIASLNGIKSPYRLKVGQVLVIRETVNVAAPSTEFNVKLKDNMSIRKGPGKDYPKATTKDAAKNGVFTIVETQGSWGLLKSYRANKNGWICIDSAYATRV